MGVRVGDLAPAFELDGVDGATGKGCRVSLAGLRGRSVVLAFYPADGSPVCTAQLRSYTEGLGSLSELDAVVLAISPQDPESHREFAADNGGFGFPLLSDQDKAVGRAFGVVGLLGLYRRSVVVVDADGRVASVSRAIGPGITYTPIDEIGRRIREARRRGSDPVGDAEES